MTNPTTTTSTAVGAGRGSFSYAYAADRADGLSLFGTPEPEPTMSGDRAAWARNMQARRSNLAMALCAAGVKVRRL